MPKSNVRARLAAASVRSTNVVQPFTPVPPSPEDEPDEEDEDEPPDEDEDDDPPEDEELDEPPSALPPLLLVDDDEVLSDEQA